MTQNDAATFREIDAPLTRANPVLFSLPEVRKFLTSLKPTPGIGPFIDVLKKQLSNYEKYERDGDEPQALAELKKSILDSVAKIEAKL